MSVNIENIKKCENILTLLRILANIPLWEVFANYNLVFKSVRRWWHACCCVIGFGVAAGCVDCAAGAFSSSGFACLRWR